MDWIEGSTHLRSQSDRSTIPLHEGIEFATFTFPSALVFLIYRHAAADAIFVIYRSAGCSKKSDPSKVPRNGETIVMNGAQAQGAGGRADASPGLLRRRYSVPETIMRKSVSPLVVFR